MYIVDTHCDSLLTVSADRGLVNAHNLSVKHPQLQIGRASCRERVFYSV